MDIRGSTAIVTGAARGIGRGIALCLARQGANLVIADLFRSPRHAPDYPLSGAQEVEKVVAEVQAMGGQAIGVDLDVTQAASIQQMVERVKAEFGRIDILVNNAGILVQGPVLGCSEETWEAVMNVNAKGVFLCSKAVIPVMQEQRRGKIINISSVAGKRGAANLAVYSASKFAVIGLTQSLAQELAPYNITVNAICPGTVSTAMWSEVLLPAMSAQEQISAEEAFQKHVATRIPLGRPQTPEDIGLAVIYLCQADNVTGTSLIVAGGSTMN
ncbi:MAG: 3-oxoacyl-ACP reductase FabG [Nitrospinota bacterium]|nr:MAG: 3-oxoacyl-ACP reductase FabG [Nitrospinota bacterium]